MDMETGFKDALAHRRSYYSISNSSPVSEQVIEDIVKFSLLNVPSAFNSQSSRAVVLFAENHAKLWDIVLSALEKVTPTEAFDGTRKKIGSFAAGYATVLFFEDQGVVESLQASFPLYAATFPLWSEQCSAMNQLAVWTMLEDVGLGASLQHYNPLIGRAVTKEWNLPEKWKLIAQMPMGKPTAAPAEKSFLPIEDRVKIFR